MNKLIKSLFAVLAVLLLVSCVCSVLAYSDQGSGEIDNIEDDSVEDSDDVISVSDDDDDVSSSDSSDGSSSGSGSSSSGGSGGVSLSNHATANPCVLLLCALTLMGVLSKRL